MANFAELVKAVALWVMANWSQVLDYAQVALGAIIAICILIPGPEPEATLQKIVDWIARISRKKNDGSGGGNALKVIFLVVALGSLSGCKTVVDLSPEAYASGDLTIPVALADGPCKAIPVQGVDVCRVKEGAPIESRWRLIVPQGKGITGGQVTVYYKDFSRTYAVAGTVVEIPFSDLISGDKWKHEDRGVLTALAELKYKDSEGVERSVRAEGMAVVIVLASDYDPLPMDSGQDNWGLNCKVQFSTAGRSALECK